MKRFPWLDTPMTLDYMVLHCVEEAGGCAHHFTYQIWSERSAPFTRQQVSSALQRLKKKGSVVNQGSYWSLAK